MKACRTWAARAVITLGAFASFAAPVMGQSYSVPRHVVAGGGGTSTGSTFSVTGTISEIGAGGALTSGPYSVTGGFWSMPLVPAEAFTDEPLAAGVTFVRALHVIELRQRVNALRVRFGLAAAAWTNDSLGGGVIRALHVTELRIALYDAYTQAGVPFPGLGDPALTPGSTPVRALHFSQLRLLVKNLEEQ